MSRFLKPKAGGKLTTPELQAIVRRMTNWQRTQWARAGYPKEPAVAARFLQRERST